MKNKPLKPDSGDAPFSETQLKIIFAAERLFAKSSIDDASLREIAIAAAQKNHYAVQYHFGSREALVRAVFAHRMQQMEDRRREMLAEAERKGRLEDTRTLLEMLFMPQLDLQDADGNHSYAKFLCQYLLRRRSRAFGDFGVQAPPQLDRIFKLLRSCLRDLSDEVAQRRLVSACFAFLSILSTYGDEATEDGEESFAQVLDDTMAQIDIAIRLPLAEKRTPKKRRVSRSA